MSNPNEKQTEAAPPSSGARWLAGIYQEVDGFYYYDPPTSGGCYAAHMLREIADKLDEMNKPWSEQIERDLNKREAAFAAPTGSANYGLFKHMSDTHKLTLLESELYDIEAEVVRAIVARDMKPMLWRICEGLAQESTTEAQHVERAEACLKAWLHPMVGASGPKI